MASTVPPPKPWSVAIFEHERPHLTHFVRERVLLLLEDLICRRIVIRAPVKSGKREIAEYIAMRDSTTNPQRVHVFISAWHRKADEDQRKELGVHNMKVFSIVNSNAVAACLQWITQKVAEGKQVVVHLDECDHGSGKKQMLSKLWYSIRENIKVTSILYSATPQEVLFSGEVDDEEYLAMMEEMQPNEGHYICYTPPPGYCGPGKFLDEGLVIEAKPFLEKSGTGFILTDQAKEILQKLRENIALQPSRNILILRLSSSELGQGGAARKDNKSIYQFLRNIRSFPELSDFSTIVDKGDDMGIPPLGFRVTKIDWSNPTYWADLVTGKPILLVIDQTSSRSTEWSCHNRIFSEHDFRNVIQFSTVSQAQERANHYEQKYGEFQPILIYGHVKTFQLSAGRIDYMTYMTNLWHKKKVDRRRAGGEDIYEIKSADNTRNHPLYPDPLTENLANRALQDIGCYASVSISARVKGKIQNKPVFSSAWRACPREADWIRVWADWETDAENTIPVGDPRRNMRTDNPFVKARSHRLPTSEWRGYHREWKLLDYHADIVPDAGWGTKDGRRIKVCYKDGLLGIAICWQSGLEPVDTLSPHNSMYK